MADQVIIDDGGSTRLKRINSGAGVMDDLFGVTKLNDNPGKDKLGSRQHVNGNSSKYQTLQVVTIDNSGTSTPLPIGGTAISNGDQIVIQSGDLTVSLEIANGGHECVITLFGTDTLAPQ